MADNQPDSPSAGKPPAPRRRSSGRSGKVRFTFRAPDQKEPIVLREEEAAEAAAYEAAQLAPRAMLPDGTPAPLSRKQRKQEKRAQRAQRTQQTDRPKPKRGKRKSMLPAVFLLLLAAVLAMAAYWYGTDPARSVLCFEGVYVGGVHLGGMTQERAAEALADNQARILADWRVTLRYGEMGYSILADDIGMEMDLSEQLAEAWRIGREGSYVERLQAVEALKREPHHASGGVSFDTALLKSALERIRADIDQEPTDATAAFEPQNEQPFQYVDEVYGRRLDVEALQAEVERYASALKNAEIDLAPTEIAPKITRAMLQNNLTCIVVVTTDVQRSSTENRNHNMRVALEKLDGQRIAPNERLSFNQVAGKRSAPENGYLEAPEIAYGEDVMGIGGGVCQVSTTLSQAAARAGLQIATRTSHAIPSDYADKGQDATVSDNGSDLVIFNNTDYPIYIRARMVEDARAGTKRCEVSIYGRPLPGEIRYTLESQQVGDDILPDPDTEYIADRKAEHAVYADQREQVLDMRVGYRVETFLVTLGADGVETGRKRISEDLYKPRPARVYVGVTPRE